MFISIYGFNTDALRWAPLENLAHRCRRATLANQLIREKTKMRTSGDSRWMDERMDG